MVAAPTFACLTPLVSLVPAPLASSWREMSRHVTLLQRPTCFSLAVLPSVESHWTPVITQMCTYLSLSWTMSFLWTMTVWMARFTTQMYFLMLSGRCQSTAKLVPNSVTCAECASKLGRTEHYTITYTLSLVHSIMYISELMLEVCLTCQRQGVGGSIREVVVCNGPVIDVDPAFQELLVPHCCLSLISIQAGWSEWQQHGNCYWSRFEDYRWPGSGLGCKEPLLDRHRTQYHWSG